MWKPIKIDEKPHFLSTKIDGDTVVCVLTDLHEWWSCRLTLEEMLKKVKVCNKRIQYETQIVLEVLQTNDPEEVSVEGEEKTLKLKYRVANRPLRYEWSLKRQTDEEMHKTLLLPLFRTVVELSTTVDELREVISKKDTELRQYKREYQILRRKAVQTEPFDLHQFDSRLAATKQIVESCQKMEEHLQTEYGLEAKTKIVAPQTTVKQEDPDERNLTPRQKKRKMLENMKRRVPPKAKERLTYLESQSQSQSVDENQEQALDAETLDTLSVKEEIAAGYLSDIPCFDEPPTTSNNVADNKSPVNQCSPASAEETTPTEVPLQTRQPEQSPVHDMDLAKKFEEMDKVFEELNKMRKNT